MPKKKTIKPKWKEVEIRRCNECDEPTQALICGDCKDRKKWGNNTDWRL